MIVLCDKHTVSNLVLTNDMKVRLLQNKIDRATEMIAARDTTYHQIED
jgi:hypothetical protein